MTLDELLQKLAAPLAFTSIFSSMAGVALLLRNNEVVRSRDLFAAVLASISASVIVYLLLLRYLEARPFLLLGVSCLAGAGGASTLDLLFAMLRRWASEKMDGPQKESDSDD